MDFNSGVKRLENDAHVFEMALHTVDKGRLMYM